MSSGVIVVRDGDHVVISKFRPPKKASEVMKALLKEGKLMDSDEIQLVGEDSLEAGDYTFITQCPSPTAAHQSGICTEQVSTVLGTPHVALHGKSLEQDIEHQVEEDFAAASQDEQLQNKRVTNIQKLFPAPLPKKEVNPKQEKGYATQKKQKITNRQLIKSPKMEPGSEITNIRMKPIPSYDQIFLPPFRVQRDPLAKYGKEALRLDFHSQYQTFMTNMRLLKN